MAASETYPAGVVDTLYRSHYAWLRSWLRFRTGDECDAADLAQDVFVRLVFKPPARHFGSAPEARAYLRKMASGMCVNLWHRREVERAWLETLAALPEPRVPSAEHQARILQALQEIGDMLADQSRNGAYAFMLALVCGMTDKEVAAELGVSPRMVRKYVAKAMLACMEIKLRHALPDHE